MYSSTSPIRFDWILMFCLATQGFAVAQEKKPEKIHPGEEIRLQFLLSPHHGYGAKVLEVRKNGTMKFQTGNLIEGYYVGIREKEIPNHKFGKNISIIRLFVKEIKENSIAIVEADPKVVGIFKVGDIIGLTRPTNSTTAIMKHLPSSFKVQVTPQDEIIQIAKYRLQRLKFALLYYHRKYNCYPPAIIYGPDGKPWHSWRVLLLPYLDHKKLYNQYRFDEPWNGPNNKKLITKMPKAFRNPIFNHQQNSFTDFAAVTGKGTVFPPEGLTLKKGGLGTWESKSGKRGTVKLKDAADDIIALTFGTVGPEKKIPWTKPEDILINVKFPRLGSKKSFSTPFKIGEKNGAMFTTTSMRELGTFLILPTVNREDLASLCLRNTEWFLDRIEGIHRVLLPNTVEIVRNRKGYTIRLLRLRRFGNSHFN